MLGAVDAGEQRVLKQLLPEQCMMSREEELLEAGQMLGEYVAEISGCWRTTVYRRRR